MLDKDIFVEQMNKLIVVYPNWKFDSTDQFTLKVWYEGFEHTKDEFFIKMINKYIRENKFAPTIAGLREYYVNEDLGKSQRVDPTDNWYYKNLLKTTSENNKDE